ncbi:MAG: hypothetical protein HY053_00645 [Proteobacteria bacterium]|nr:hypothetical protein [Pseudomonadota bacterium]
MKNFIPAGFLLAVTVGLFTLPVGAAILVLDGNDVMLLDDSGGWHNVGDSRDSDYRRFEYQYPVYDYHNTGDPANYEGEPYQNFRGYNNTGGYANTYFGYIGRPGYQGGYYY